MFTGIIEAVGRVAAIETAGPDARARIETRHLDLSEVKVGDSLAVSGVCLTVVEVAAGGFRADVSAETLARTCFGELRAGSAVNLERALLPSTRMGGHLVSGHVDGVGRVVSREKEGRSVRLRFQAPASLARYIAEKGSICVDGVSLTVNEVDGACFAVNLVPHTLDCTTLSGFRAGRCVNLEVDLVARYLERLLLGERAADIPSGGITRELLSRHGFLEGDA